MEREGVRFLNPATVESIGARKTPTGPLTVTLKVDGKSVAEEFDTVLYAIGRTPLTNELGLDKPGVSLHKNGKILVDGTDATSATHVFAIGDVCADSKGGPRDELTPVAIQAGKLLARRLYAGASKLMDYNMVPTVVFTPHEYGTVGLTEEQAESKCGANNVEVFHVRYGALETAVSYRENIPTPRSAVFTGANLDLRQFALANNRPYPNPAPGSFDAEEESRKALKQPCLAKLVCDKTQNNKVLGLHYIGPNAGEVLQGFALAVRVGVTKDDFDDLVGIHPTTAEEFTTLSITKSSGEDWMKKGGC